MYRDILGFAVATILFFVVSLYLQYRRNLLSKSTFPDGISKKTLHISFQRLAAELVVKKGGPYINPSWFLVLDAVSGRASGFVWERAENGKLFLVSLKKEEAYQATVKLPNNGRVMIIALKKTGNMLIDFKLAELVGLGVEFEAIADNLVAFGGRKVS